jgi:peptidoglycan-N-acetylglucosamine deacetylase
MRFVRYPIISKIFFPKAIYSFPAKAGKLFLSFDDGPNPITTPKILDILRKYNCKATFFCLGENAAKYPDLLQLIKDNGHLIGNHGYSHLNGFRISTNDFIENIKKAEPIFNTSIFRPPYGKMTISQYRASSKHYKIILWDVMSYDFDSDLTVSECVNNVIKFARNGSIIVFHDNEKAISKTEKILPLIIEHYSTQNCFSQILPIT